MCVLLLCRCCWFCVGPTMLALEMRDLQDWQQQLKCILDVVGAVGALQRGDTLSSHTQTKSDLTFFTGDRCVFQYKQNKALNIKIKYCLAIYGYILYKKCWLHLE